MRRIRVEGLSLFRGEQKLFVRGLSYGPFSANSRGEPLPEPERVRSDLALLRELGANALRLYHVPPTWFSDLCGESGVHTLVGIPWAQHIRFLESARGRSDIRASVRQAARALRSREELLGFFVGNEIPPQVVRWYGPRKVARFVEDLVDEIRQQDPAALVSYANFPMTEYLELANLDFVSFNVYLHRRDDLRSYLTRLQNLAGPRPLLLSEFGVDSVREGEAAQARILSDAIETAAEVGCAGSVVFSYTDEWHTGGFDIEDWSFGLVRADRTRKPAFESVARHYRSRLPGPLPRAPRVSVVICAYNAERTMRGCLESLRRLEYPNFEVIVVDDGSTDATLGIARDFPEFTLITHENRGLSTARNEGIEAATGEIVAYTDSDCEVDYDWLTYLVGALTAGDYAGVGGPNLAPREENWVPEAVARAPGGPTHVLLGDLEAEHIPGCNMAFWRKDLVEVGLFDPVFRTAGDDVDICWRLQELGHRIGFAPAALVWHRQRRTVSAYLKQQRGYGDAEGQLFFKHPYRFNRLGQSRWLGRIYNGEGPGLLGGRARVHGGPFGLGLFQTLYEPSSSVLRYLPASLEWNALAALLLGGGAASHALGTPAPGFWLAGLALVAVSVGHAVFNALRVDVSSLPRLRARGLIAWMNFTGPLVRGLARYQSRLLGAARPARRPASRTGARPVFDLLRRRMTLSYWSESGVEKEACVVQLIDFFRAHRYPILVDDGWQSWDLSVLDGIWLRAEINTLVQNHGGEKREVDVEARFRQNTPAKLLKCIFLVLAALGASMQSASTVAAAALPLAMEEALLFIRARRLARSIYHGVEVGLASLELLPLSDPKQAEGVRGAPVEEGA